MDKERDALTVLVVDDDETVCTRLGEILRNWGYEIESCESAERALERVEVRGFDVVLMDIQLPGRTGLEALEDLSKSHPSLPIIMITAHASLNGAVEAIRNQAFDYLIKPVSPPDLKSALERATRLHLIESEDRSQRESAEINIGTNRVIAKSAAMSEVLDRVRQLSENESSVLIRGESGTGKDIIARTIHDEGTRSAGPFVAINCAALPESLLESELFGYVKGAFTGADQTRSGLLANADGGTMFLDEIAEMSPALQSKLLRVLQDGRVRPLGAGDDFRVNVRILAATNCDLEQAVRDGRFRADLYYRLNVIPIRLEALRERLEDISPLAQMFVSRQDPERYLSADAIAKLEKHDWPGNVRELSNVIERSLALTKERALHAQHILIDGTFIEPGQGDLDPIRDNEGFCDVAAARGLSLKEFANAYIEEVLKRTDGNKTEAARILGINRATLYRRRSE